MIQGIRYAEELKKVSGIVQVAMPNDIRDKGSDKCERCGKCQRIPVVDLVRVF